MGGRFDHVVTANTRWRHALPFLLGLRDKPVVPNRAGNVLQSHFHCCRQKCIILPRNALLKLSVSGDNLLTCLVLHGKQGQRYSNFP